LEIRIIAPDFSVTYSSDDDAYVAGLSFAMSGVLNLEDGKDLLTAQRDENSVRIDFLASEAVALAQDFQEEEKKAAAQRAVNGHEKMYQKWE